MAKAGEVIGERWTPLILQELIYGSRRINEIHRGVPLMSPSLLSHRLTALERAGVVERRSQSGAKLQPLIEMLGTWAAALGPEPAARERSRSRPADLG